MSAKSKELPKTDAKVREYGLPVEKISPAAVQRLKKMKDWAERSKRFTGLVGQSKPRF